MGHHHHHGGGHHHGPGAPIGWPLAIGLTAALFAYGAIEGFATYRVYFHGVRGLGVVSVWDEHADTTIVEIEGQVCALSGRFGHVGAMLPVAYPAGRPGNCVVREPSSFRWSGGALVVSTMLMIAIWMWRRGSTSNARAA